MTLFNTRCCGVRDFQGLRKDPEDTLRGFCEDTSYTGTDGAFYLFSGTWLSSLNKLERYIKRNKLGTVYSTGYAKNPNSGNWLKVLIFKPNKVRLQRWVKEKARAIKPFPRSTPWYSFQEPRFSYVDRYGYLILLLMGISFVVWVMLLINLGLFIWG